MVNIIMGKSSGFNVMPRFLATLCAHIAEHDVILAKIEAGQYDHLVSTVPWDERMAFFINNEYNTIVERKDEILGSMEQDHQRKQKTAEEYDGDEKKHLKMVSGDTKEHHPLVDADLADVEIAFGNGTRINNN